MKAKRALIIVAITLFWGCFGGKSNITSDNSNKVKKYISNVPPKKIDKELNVEFGDKVVLLGYDIDKVKAKAGTYVNVTWYWKCLKSPGPGWRLMTHGFDGRGTVKLNTDRPGPIRENFQPEHWKSGLFISDHQRIRVPSGWDDEILDLRTGLWKGDTRMEAKGKYVDTSGRRALGPKIEVLLKKKASHIYYVVKATTPPVIDGKIDDDPAWKDLADLDSFLETMAGSKVQGAIRVKLLWDADNLYVSMVAEDNYLYSEYKNHDDPLWKQDAFEMFLDPLGDGKNYYEFQVNPTGVVFDSQLPTHRDNHNEWESNMIVKTTINGALNSDKGEDKSWAAEMAIPFSALAKEEGVPPTVDTKWKANFFHIDLGKEKTIYSAWSPPLVGDFHATDKFGSIVFVDKIPATSGIATENRDNPSPKSSDNTKESAENAKPKKTK